MGTFKLKLFRNTFYELKPTSFHFWIDWLKYIAIANPFFFLENQPLGCRYVPVYLITIFLSFDIELKVTVQFETEENGQNEIFSHMDKSEVKL